MGGCWCRWLTSRSRSRRGRGSCWCLLTSRRRRGFRSGDGGSLVLCGGRSRLGRDGGSGCCRGRNQGGTGTSSPSAFLSILSFTVRSSGNNSDIARRLWWWRNCSSCNGTMMNVIKSMGSCHDRDSGKRDDEEDGL